MQAEVERLHATANKLSALADEFADDVEMLRREAETVMTGEWTGDASDSHAVLWTEWVEAARTVIGALMGDAGLLRQAADGYAMTESGTENSMPSIDLGLDT